MTTSRFNTIAVTTWAMFAVGCAREPAADPMLCSNWADIKPLPAPTSSVQFMDQAERCVRRMSYKLSIAQGSNGEIADAAVSSCTDDIGAVAASYHMGDQMASASQLQDMSDATRADEEDYRKSARTWVIESRAGHCAKVLEKTK